ncbi:recombinase family protein [Micrococcus luteus]|uniref:recombinase family protein n=1 Tax=Micrococcus luteus TaxID=1270 RepID=UPI003016275C|nr:recombinase family protein [Micrococcus luteus]
MPPAALYLRQSKDRARDEAAVDRQEAACRALAEAKGIKELRLYVDNDRSATAGERPEFERLLEDVRAGHVSVVIVFHLDRLTRSIRDLTRVIEAGQPRRLNIASVHGVGIDLGDPTGVAVATILTAVAAMEVQHKGTRQRAANRQRAERGAAFWTRRPFGYDREDGRVYVVEREAEAIREGARMILEDGATLSAVMRAWDADGLRTTGKNRAGEPGRWSVTKVRGVLLNPRYAGRRMYNGEDVGPGDWPAILDRDTFDDLTVKLTDPRRRTAPDDLNAKHLLSGILTCGKCGARMFAAPSKYRGNVRMTYRCHGGYCMGRGMEDVDRVVTAVLLARLAQPDALAAMSPTEDVQALHARAADLRDRRDALAELLADGLMSPTAVREQAGRLNRDLTDLEGRLAAATGSDPVVNLIQSEDVAASWEAAPVAERRRIVRTLMEVTLLPVGKGTRFAPEHVRIAWKGGNDD